MANLRKVKLVVISRMFEARPEWAYPSEDNGRELVDSKHNQEQYMRAIGYLRSDVPSKWIMDEGSPKAKWTMNPLPKESKSKLL